MVVNYSQGKIYKIWSPSTGLTYIGSTCQPLSIRIGGHRAHKRLYEAGKRDYITSFKVLDQPDHRIDLIEYFPCNNKTELNKREGEVILQTDCVNKLVAGQTREEYRERNKDKLSEIKKEYYEQNKEKILANVKKYAEEHKEEKKEYLAVYYVQNSEKIRNRSKKHYEMNKETANARKAEQHECMCGKIYTLGHKTRHEKTKWHIEYIENLECED